MRRCFLAVAAVATFIISSGCGGHKSTTNPATMIIISPSSVSLNTGGTQAFTAKAVEADGTTAVTPQPEITFSISGSSVTLNKSANNGVLACAGTWDANFIVCTPGPVAPATLTASGGGLTSAPVTISVHQKVDKLTLSPASLSTCISSGATQQFTATAFSNGTDVTSTVGTINWLSTTTSVATVDANGLATAATPGGSTIFANVGNVTSLPVPFTTCPPKSISLHIQNAGDTSFTLDAAATQQLTADVTDINGNPVANAPLTYTVLPSAVGSVSGAGLATAVVPGVGEIVASCTPPTCNINLNYPVYSNLVTMNVNGTTVTKEFDLSRPHSVIHDSCTYSSSS